MNIPTVELNDTIKSTMQVINEHGFGIAFVVDGEKRLAGVVTDGDLRRAILAGTSLNAPTSTVMNENPVRGFDSWSEKELQQYLKTPDVVKRFPKLKPLVIPILDRNKRIIRFEITYDEGTHIDASSSEIETMTKPKHVLVLGGAGYIGSVLCRMLLDLGYSVKVLDNLIYGDSGIQELYGHDNFELINGDVTDIVSIVDAMKDVDAIVHLAAIVGDPAGKTKPKETLQVNYFSTGVLADVAKYLGISRFVFASTCSIYGFREDKCLEEHKPNPLSLYAETKVMSEEAILERVGDGFCPTILRFATIYGLSPRMRFDLVVNLFIAKATLDQEITVYGQGRQRRPFLHVRDVCRSIIKVMEAPMKKICGEIFNVGLEEYNMSIMELAKKINDEITEATLVTIDEKEDDRSYDVSFEKIRQQLDFTPQESVLIAIEEIREYITKNGITDYKDKKFSNYATLKEQ
ncbi:MAG: NAD-dependent epimerase/dehydratase family protein [Promethearchaeota archaeon]